MTEKANVFEQAEITLYRVKNELNLSDLQFERIKSTISKAAIWDSTIDNLIADFINELNDDELNDDEREEMEFRYEAAKLASSSSKELWNQLNKCADIEFSKESILMILSSFIKYFEELANEFNNHEDTEILVNLRKTLEDIKNQPLF